jgi:glycosyltransferase involved in cell wall biosynthesis
LTVARAVPKKGLSLLLAALARMPAEPDWTWTHIGGGPDLPALIAAAQTHPYKDRLVFLGARPHADVMSAMARHDVFVLTAQIAADGDRDGRPNALIEAMSAGLACVATGVGGIPELLAGQSGIIVPDDADAIAAALEDLLLRPETVPVLGSAAQARAAALDVEGRAAFASLERALRDASGQ